MADGHGRQRRPGPRNAFRTTEGGRPAHARGRLRRRILHGTSAAFTRVRVTLRGDARWLSPGSAEAARARRWCSPQRMIDAARQRTPASSPDDGASPLDGERPSKMPAAGRHRAARRAESHPAEDERAGDVPAGDHRQRHRRRHRPGGNGEDPYLAVAAPPSTRSRGNGSGGSSSPARRSRPVNRSDSSPATCRPRWTRTSARSTTRSRT